MRHNTRPFRDADAEALTSGQVQVLLYFFASGENGLHGSLRQRSALS
ncbi:UNVERIFIED_ORG: hypothetical protein GGE64_003023 [Rhizobium etli]